MIDREVFDDGRRIYTVSELNREIKCVLEDAYPDIWLEGEISNFRRYSSGHMYFSLKDSESQLQAVLFNGVARKFRFDLGNGLKVVVRGRVSSYPKRGDYQVIVFFIEPAGVGALHLAFEQLKARLTAEGLFDRERKKTIPLLPRRIGIVTSRDGAAIRDIVSVITRRFADVELLLYPVRVQGDGAAKEIAAAVRWFNDNRPDTDVLLVGRGGGSYEDLWAFNEEVAVRAVADSRIPVISCVGHETDFTITDFVADLRAPTPSAAAELVVRNKSELTRRLSDVRRRLENGMRYAIERREDRLGRLAASRALAAPAALFTDRIQELDDLLHRLDRSARRILERKQGDFRVLSEKLNLLSPLHALNRGYAVCRTHPEGRLVKRGGELSPGDGIRVTLAAGGFTGRVDTVDDAARTDYDII